MNADPTLADWLRTFVVLGGGAAVVAALAALAAWPMRSGVGRRTVWQAATLALAVLVVVETTGLAGGVCAWLAVAPPPPLTFEGEAGPASHAALPPAEELPPEPAEESPEPAQEAAHGVWWPGTVWLVGATVAAAWFGAARLLLLRLRQRPVSDPTLCERCNTLARRLGLRRRVRLLECDGLAGPAAFGVVWPAVAVPARFTEDFTPAQQEAVLAHELGHLAGGDPAWRLLSDVVTALLWWHPLVWEVRLRLRGAGEEAADEASVVVPDGPALLADCLVRLGRRLTAGGAGAWERMAGGGFRSGLGRRVERLLRLDAVAVRSPGRLRRLLVLALTPLLVPAAVVVTTAWAQAQDIPEGDEPMNAVQRSWRRSLAAMVLVAALGPGPDAPAADPPGPTEVPAPGGNPVPAKETPKGLLDKIRAAEEAKAAQDRDLKKLQEELATRKLLYEKLKQIEAPPGKRSGLVEKEIRDLEQKAKAIKEQYDALEAKVNALREELKRDRDVPRIKVFRLVHRDPIEVQEVLNRMLPRDTIAGDGGGAGMGGAIPEDFGPRGFGPRGGAGGMGRPMGAGMAGGMQMGFFGSRPSWRLAIDRRTNSLIVRGSEADLKTASDFVAMLDIAEGRPLPQVKNIRAFHLKFADAEVVAHILESLELGALVAPVKKGRMIVVSGPETTLKEVAELVAAVDVEGKGAIRDPEKK